MSHAVEGAEVRGQSGPFPDSVNASRVSGPLLSPTPGKHIWANKIFGVSVQEFPGCRVQWYGLILAALGLSDMDKAPLKIYIIPLEFE